MRRDTTRRYIRLLLATVAATLLSFLGYCAWPWIASMPWKLGPLAEYRIYQQGELLEGSSELTQGGWRKPKSRLELFLTPYSSVLHGEREFYPLKKHAHYRPRPESPPIRIP